MRFQQVNVFASDPLKGNPVAVIHSDKELSSERMQELAKWTNLSETTFVFPPKTKGADYFVRIWTPWGELPFAGHPTLGTAFSVLGDSGKESIVQECGAGLVNVVKMNGKLHFEGPKVVKKPLDSGRLAAITSQLGLSTDQVVDSSYLSNGPDFEVLQLDSFDTVINVDQKNLVFGEAEGGFAVGLCAIHNGKLEVRLLLPGNVEDPITGSLNGCLADWLISAGKLPANYTANQGRCIGRQGEVSVVTVDNKIWIGGSTQVVVDGTITF